MSTESGSAVGEKVDQAKETVAEQAGEVKERGRNVAMEQLDERSTQVGEQVGTATRTLRSVANQSRMEGNHQQARMAEAAAERGERLSNYLVEADGQRMLREAEDFARREPWVVVAAGLAVGFVLARSLKASSSTRYQRRQLPMRTAAGWSDTTGTDWAESPAGRLPYEHEPRVPARNEAPPADVGARS